MYDSKSFDSPHVVEEYLISMQNIIEQYMNNISLFIYKALCNYIQWRFISGCPRTFCIFTSCSDTHMKGPYGCGQRRLLSKPETLSESNFPEKRTKNDPTAVSELMKHYAWIECLDFLQIQGIVRYIYFSALYF